jgi:CheY-like chemotaxis protein
MRSNKAGVVLVVDDVSHHLEAMTVALTGSGYAVLAAATVEQGFSKAVLHKPDVIILDLHLPPEPPWELCQRLRDDKRTRRIPLIILTAEARPELQQRASYEGCAAILLKPIDPLAVVNAVERIIDPSSPGLTRH